MPKVILRKKSKNGRISSTNFKTYSKSSVTETMWNWWEDKHIDKWNRKQRQYGQLFFDKVIVS